MVQRLREKIVRQVEALQIGEAGDVLSKLSYSVVGEVEMFNIGQQCHIGVLTEEVSHHGVGHLDGLQIVESGKVLSLQTLDQTVRDLDAQHITGSGELDIQEISAQYFMVVLEVALWWRVALPGGVEVGAVEDKSNLEVFTVTVGDDDFRQETEERLGESQQDNGGDPHLSPGT